MRKSVNSLLRFCTTDTAQIFAAWVLSTALFAALITYISKHPHKRTLPLKIFFAAMFIGGTAMYCTVHSTGWRFSRFSAAILRIRALTG